MMILGLCLAPSEKQLMTKMEKELAIYINSALDAMHSGQDQGVLGLPPEVFSVISENMNTVDSLFLLSHHPPGWLQPASLSALNQLLAHMENASKRLFLACGHNHETDANRCSHFPGRAPFAIGSLMGVHGRHYELPDFAIYDTRDEKQLCKVYRFLPHLNFTNRMKSNQNVYEGDQIANGGWKLIPATMTDLYPAQTILSMLKD